MILRVASKGIETLLIDCGQVSSTLRTADVSPRSSPLRDVSRGGTSATQRQKFHTDDVNQCLHIKSGSHGVPNATRIKAEDKWSLFTRVRRCRSLHVTFK